jgi:hypothetical protein
MPQFTQHDVTYPEVYTFNSMGCTPLFWLPTLSLVLTLPKNVLGQAEQHCTLHVYMVSSLYSTVQLITTHNQPLTSLENLKGHGQKDPPVKSNGNALVRSMLPKANFVRKQSPLKLKNHESVRKMAELTIKHCNHALCLAQFGPS